MAASFAETALAHQWLSLSGVGITKEESLTSPQKWTFLFTHLISFYGSGELTISCDGDTQGVVLPGGKDRVKLSTNLSGGEADKLKCESKSSSVTICGSRELIVEQDNLPWSSELILNGSFIEDALTAPEGGKEVGFVTTCGGTKVLCGISLETLKFIGNSASGAEFELTEATTNSCTIGQGLYRGKETILGFLAN